MRETGVRLAEAGIALFALLVLAITLLRDFISMLRGKLKPQKESQLYWRILYSWMLIGLPFGTHRVIASKVSWRIFPMMNIYGIALLCVGEIYFKDNEGDPDVDPTKFGRGTTIAVDGLAGVMFLIPLLLWLRTQ